MFLRIIDFADFLYAKYAKPIFAFIDVCLDLSSGFAYSHTFSILVENCYFKIWSVLMVACMRRFVISHTFA